MLKRLFNFLLLSNGITPADDAETETDKWSRIRAEREAWEHEQKMSRAAPAEPQTNDAEPDDAHQ